MKTLMTISILMMVGCASPDDDCACGEWDSPDTGCQSVGGTAADTGVEADTGTGSGDTDDSEPDTVVGIGVGTDETAADHTWTDSATGYGWSASFGEKRFDTRLHAIQYCENLTVNGKSDWELANIDELRTLIRNCPRTQSGGACDTEVPWYDYEGCGSCVGDSPSIKWFGTPEVASYSGVSSVLSSSLAMGGTVSFWTVQFHSGSVFHASDPMTSGYLCVR